MHYTFIFFFQSNCIPLNPSADYLLSDQFAHSHILQFGFPLHHCPWLLFHQRRQWLSVFISSCAILSILWCFKPCQPNIHCSKREFSQKNVFTIHRLNNESVPAYAYKCYSVNINALRKEFNAFYRTFFRNLHLEFSV